MLDFYLQSSRFRDIEKHLDVLACRRVKLNWRYNHPEPWEDYPIPPPDYIDVPYVIMEYEIDDWVEYHVEHPYCYELESWEFVN